MKKLITAFMILATAAVFAGVKNTLISFSTPGPDKYADGTTVLDGECYALVYTPKGSTFQGILANGTAAGDSTLVVAAPVAKDGKCPMVVFQIDEDVVAKKYNGGTFGVYLLDTRMTVGGKVTVGLNAAGKPQTVAAVAKLGTATSAAGVMANIGGAAVVAGAATDVPDEAKNLKITSVKVVGALVEIKATGTVPYLQYGISTGDSPDKLATVDVAPATGKASQEEEITIYVEKKGDSQFFKVDRK